MRIAQVVVTGRIACALTRRVRRSGDRVIFRGPLGVCGIVDIVRNISTLRTYIEPADLVGVCPEAPNEPISRGSSTWQRLPRNLTHPRRASGPRFERLIRPVRPP